MSIQGKLGLQGRLGILVVAAILPLALLALWSASRGMRSATQMAQSQLQLSAALVAANQDRTVDSTRNLLSAISLMHELRSGDRQRCERFFEGLHAHYPIYANVGLLRPDGGTACHAGFRQGDASLADRRFFQDAVRQRGFAMGAPITGRITGRLVIPFGLAVVEGDAVVGVVFAALDVALAGKTLGGLELPDGARVALTDRRATLLMEHPSQQDLPERRTLTDPELQLAARDLLARVGEVTNAEGESRIYAAAPSRRVGDEGFLAIVSIDRAQLAQVSLANLRDDMVVLGLTLLAGLAGAWWFGRRSIVTPARDILRVVQRLQRGELDARVPLQARWQGSEFSRIADAFNLMADALQLRQRNLQAELAHGQGAYEVLEQVLNSMPDGLIAISSSGEVLMYNHAAARLMPLDLAPPPTAKWPRAYGLFRADGRTLYAPEDLPLMRAARGESGSDQEMLVRNKLVPEGRFLHCTFRPMHRGDQVTGGLVLLADVTGRRKTESDLVLLRKAVARLNDIVMITEAGPLSPPGPRIVFVNEAFKRLTGYAAKEAIGNTPAMLYGVNTDMTVLARMRKSLLAGKAVREEIIYYARDGSRMCLEQDVVPLIDEGGAFTHLIGVLRDVTQRKEAEQALLASDQELQQFTRMLQRTAEAAQSITSQHSLRGTMQEVADQARVVVGCHEARVSLITEDDWSEAVTAQSVSRRNAVFRGTRPVPDGAGVYALVTGSGRPLRISEAELRGHSLLRGQGGDQDAHPQIRGLLAVPLAERSGRIIGLLQLLDNERSDFTESDEYVAVELAHLGATAIENARLFQQIRQFNTSLEARIAERTAELTRQEARFRALADQAPEVVWNTDETGRLTYVNRAWYELVGGAPDDWQASQWIERVHPEDTEAMLRNWVRSREHLLPYTGTRRILGRDGSWHTMSYRATPVLDERGAVVFWVGIDSDVTELKAIEQALRNSNEELQAFSYSVSHDLRAPLGAIGGFARALEHRMGPAADERSVHYLARIQAGVAKMEQLIDAMLSLATVARAPLTFEPVNLSALAGEALEDLRVQQPQRNVAIVVQEGLVALGDPRLLRIVMENLLGNAWKFTARRERGEIEVGTKGGGVFYVRDNGAGFDMIYADKLFGTFQRLHTESEFPGTGIGLATVRRVIARHQGRVWCESRVDEGTTFFFSLSALAPPAWLAAPADAP